MSVEIRFVHDLKKKRSFGGAGDARHAFRRNSAARSFPMALDKNVVYFLASKRRFYTA